MKDDTHPQRIKLDYMPFDHWDRERGYSHCTGYEVRESSDPADWWYEYEDEDGNTFLAR